VQVTELTAERLGGMLGEACREEDTMAHMEIGQIVRRRDQSQGAGWGLIIGLVLLEPVEALVRWSDGTQSTFELMDNLVDAIQFFF